MVSNPYHDNMAKKNRPLPYTAQSHLRVERVDKREPNNLCDDDLE